jgi:hypothetical protein
MKPGCVNLPSMTTVADAAPRWQALLHRWPSALGLAAAALLLALGPDTETIATAVGVAALCYLGAAALDRRWVAWAGCAAFSLVVVASQAVMGSFGRIEAVGRAARPVTHLVRCAGR